MILLLLTWSNLGLILATQKILWELSWIWQVNQQLAGVIFWAEIWCLWKFFNKLWVILRDLLRLINLFELFLTVLFVIEHYQLFCLGLIIWLNVKLNMLTNEGAYFISLRLCDFFLIVDNDGKLFAIDINDFLWSLFSQM